jgi:hypothetical protein
VLRGRLPLLAFVSLVSLPAGCSTDANNSRPTVVSQECRSAMATLAAETTKPASDTEQATFLADSEATLQACKSRAEWLEAAKSFTTSNTTPSGCAGYIVCGGHAGVILSDGYCNKKHDKPACR